MYYIVFTDSSTKEVSDTEGLNIIKLSTEPNKQGVIIAGDFYKFNSISKVLDDKEYYSQYPDRRVEKAQEFLALDSGDTQLNRFGTGKRALDGIIKGLKKFILEQKTLGIKTPNADKLLIEAEEKLELLIKKQP